MTDKKSIESRRKILKSIAAGSGAIVAGKSLPESWSRPVVDSVLLPAHAQTSLCNPLFSIMCELLRADIDLSYGDPSIARAYVNFTHGVVASCGPSPFEIDNSSDALLYRREYLDVGSNVVTTYDGSTFLSESTISTTSNVDATAVSVRITFSFADTATFGDATCVLTSPLTVIG